MRAECICTSWTARYRCDYAIPGTELGCDLLTPCPSPGERGAHDQDLQLELKNPQKSDEPMSDNTKHQGKAQSRQEKSKRYWLKLAKQERTHAIENKLQKQKDGNEYAASVYHVRVKALDHYIKLLQQQEVV